MWTSEHGCALFSTQVRPRMGVDYLVLYGGECGSIDNDVCGVA